MSATFTKPATSEYNEYYHRYISLFDPNDFISEFNAQPDQLDQLLSNISDEEADRLHDPFTWSLKQVVGHLIDCERIFSYRALRIGVGDTQPIPGIDQNIYVANCNYRSVLMNHLLSEFRLLREANGFLAARMTDENLCRTGEASGNMISAKANWYILGGHFNYHFAIMRKRLTKSDS